MVSIIMIIRYYVDRYTPIVLHYSALNKIRNANNKTRAKNNE